MLQLYKCRINVWENNLSGFFGPLSQLPVLIPVVSFIIPVLLFIINNPSVRDPCPSTHYLDLSVLYPSNSFSYPDLSTPVILFIILSLQFVTNLLLFIILLLQFVINLLLFIILLFLFVLNLLLFIIMIVPFDILLFVILIFQLVIHLFLFVTMIF
jgi:hypothetical protein